MSAKPTLNRFFLVGVVLAAAVGWLWQWLAELSFDGMQHARFWSEALVVPVVLLTAALAWKPWQLPRTLKTVGELHQERERLQQRLRSADQLRQALGAALSRLFASTGKAMPSRSIRRQHAACHPVGVRAFLDWSSASGGTLPITPHWLMPRIGSR